MPVSKNIAYGSNTG